MNVSLDPLATVGCGQRSRDRSEETAVRNVLLPSNLPVKEVNVRQATYNQEGILQLGVSFLRGFGEKSFQSQQCSI